jgi:hypothetical protein
LRAELRTRSRRSGGFKSAWRRSDNKELLELLDAVAAERQEAIAAG